MEYIIKIHAPRKCFTDIIYLDFKNFEKYSYIDSKVISLALDEFLGITHLALIQGSCL